MPTTKDQALSFFETASQDIPKFSNRLKKSVDLMVTRVEADDYQSLKTSYDSFNSDFVRNARIVKPYNYDIIYESIMLLQPDFDRYDMKSAGYKVLNYGSCVDEIYVNVRDFIDYTKGLPYDTTEKIPNAVSEVVISLQSCVTRMAQFDKAVAEFLESIK